MHKAHLERSTRGSQVYCPDGKSGNFKIDLLLLKFQNIIKFILFYFFIYLIVLHMAHLGSSDQGSLAYCLAEKSGENYN